ncbi:MAG: nuclear transport factor 2 family protein [Minicystis sp.]
MNDTPSPLSPAERAARALLRFIGTDIEAWLSLLADDAVVEFPYAPSIQRPARLEGKAAIAAYFRPAIALFRDLTFRDVRLVPGADPDVAVVEAHGAATIATTGKRYEQDYVVFVRTRNDQVVSYREYWNPLPGIAAFGLDDLPGGAS